MSSMMQACDQTQEALHACFWDEKKGRYHQSFPYNPDEKFCYWWHAHVIDTLLDAYIRTADEKYMVRIEEEICGVKKKNGNTFLNNWYDDMEWMALALLRLYDVTKSLQYKKEVEWLWADIKTAWNEYQGGGLAWKKDQLDYKNTPANAPAAILGYRLYQRFQNPDDFVWANKIFAWNFDNLVDKQTGFVWDGKNRLGNNAIDYDWEYTYCQGVFVGAALEKYKITKDPADLAIAEKTAKEATRRLCNEKGGVFPYEGKEDCGLFKGIMMRYFLKLYEISPNCNEIKDTILSNAVSVRDNAINSQGLIGGHWNKVIAGPIDLAQHLSGIMVLEAAEVLGKQMSGV